MEKRLILAVLISFFILYSWSRINGQAPINESKNIQVVENKELKEQSVAAEQNPVDVDPVDQKGKIVENIETLENNSLKCEFSNIGGSLKSVYIKDYDKALPITNIGSISRYKNYNFDLIKNIGNTITYSLSHDDIEVLKTYTLDENNHSLIATIALTNQSPEPINLDLKINSMILYMSSLDNFEKSAAYNRDKNLFEYALFFQGSDYRKNKAYKFDEKKNYITDKNVQFAAFRDRYYCAIYKPEYENNGASLHTQNEKTFNMSILVDANNLAAGETREFSSLIYVGPEKIDILKKYNLGFERIQKFYKLGLFDFIAKLIFRILHFIHMIVPNWGMSIILVSLVIYFSTYPLTMKSMKSMKKMQTLQPKINSLKEKHKNNPQKMNMEVMELYKKHKINPLGGCLPMLLQMPVFIGLYQVLWRAVDFKGANFLWIKDLSMPDRIFILPMELPIIGNEINLLPIVMMVVMFFQQKISAKNMNATDPAQIQQQKMMSTIFPLFLGFIFYRFASGLTLYFTMFYILSTFTQYRISRANEVQDGE